MGTLLKLQHMPSANSCSNAIHCRFLESTESTSTTACIPMNAVTRSEGNACPVAR